MNAGFPSVKLHRLIELDYSATGTAALTFYTDLPGDAMALRETNTIPLTTARRVVVFHLLGTTKGKLLKIKIAPTAQFRLFGLRVYARSLGRTAGPWQWYAMPVVDTPDGWQEVSLAIERTPDAWEEVHLAAIDRTPDGWQEVSLAIGHTPDAWEEVHLAAIEPTPNEWNLLHLPIPSTPDEWSDVRLPIEDTPDILRWAEIAMDE